MAEHYYNRKIISIRIETEQNLLMTKDYVMNLVLNMRKNYMNKIRYVKDLTVQLAI